tara:strand:- start:89 stop:544 length:456 start_codon:yes stop_codon:yes gene_type:complete
MGDLIIKPAVGAGNKLILQNQASGVVLTTTDTGVTMQGLGGTDWVEVRTDNFQLEVNKNYMIDSGSLVGLPMNLTMPSSAVMGDKIILLDATRTNHTNSWIINPNGLDITSPGSGTSTWTVNALGTQYELVYFVSTRSAGLSGWVVRNTVT